MRKIKRALDRLLAVVLAGMAVTAWLTFERTVEMAPPWMTAGDIRLAMGVALAWGAVLAVLVRAFLMLAIRAFWGTDRRPKPKKGRKSGGPTRVEAPCNLITTPLDMSTWGFPEKDRCLHDLVGGVQYLIGVRDCALGASDIVWVAAVWKDDRHGRRFVQGAAEWSPGEVVCCAALPRWSAE